MSRIKLIKSFNSMTIEQAFKDFLEHCKMKNLSKATLKNYNSNFRIFSLFLDESHPVNSIDQQVINRFTTYLQNHYKNPVSVNSTLRHIRSVVNFWIEEGYCQHCKVKLLKEEQTIKEAYTDQELAILLKKPDLKKCRFPEYRTYVMVNFLLATGCRARTLVNIKIQDLDFDSGFVKLLVTKNRKPQLLPLSQSLQKVLKEYLKHRGGSPEEYLFPSESNTQMLVSSVNHAVADYNRSRGVETVGVHRFRHTFARNFVLSGGDVFRLQKTLGHSTLEMSRKYCNLYDTDLQKDFEQFNLLERLTTQNSRIAMR